MDRTRGPDYARAAAPSAPVSNAAARQLRSNRTLAAAFSGGDDLCDTDDDEDTPPPPTNQRTGKSSEEEKEKEEEEKDGEEQDEGGKEDTWDAALRGDCICVGTGAFFDKGTTPGVSGRPAFPLFAVISSHLPG